MKKIKLGIRKPISTYGGFLIVKCGGSYTIWDTKNDCEINPPYLNENTPWEEIDIQKDAVILTAFPKRLLAVKVAPTTGYVRGVKCIFLRSKGDFLLSPDDNDVIFDDILVKGGKICCTTKSFEKIVYEHWFDMEGNHLATRKNKAGDTFYTVKLANGDELDKLCEVHPIEDSESREITGLHIICMTKDNGDFNFFYSF